MIPSWLKPLFTRSKSGCWEWNGRIRQDGYGGVTVARQDRSAHREVYKKFYDVSLRRTQLVCHKCDNRKCIRPSHLFVGSSKDNSVDMMKKGRSAYGYKNGLARFGESEAREIVRRYLAKELTQEELAVQFGVVQTVISSIVTGRTWGKVTGISYRKKGRGQAHGVRVSKYRKRGAEHHSSPFTEVDVKKIRKLREAGWTLVALAETFGVSSQAIHSIVIRKTWRHL